MLSVLLMPLTPIFYIVGVRVLTNCRTNGIGHLAIEPAWYLAQVALRKKKRVMAPILFPFWGGGYANHALAESLKKYFIVVTSPSLTNLCRALGVFSFLAHDIGVAPMLLHQQNFQSRIDERNCRQARMSKDIQLYRDRYGPLIIDLPEALIEAGEKNLSKIGIKPGEWFVCLHGGEVSTNGTFKYDLYRRQTIKDFRGVINTVKLLGGKVVRMGDGNLPPAPPDLALIDYACSKYKSDWMDLFLVHKCRYFVGCNSGLQSVAVIYGKPQIITNVIPWPMLLTFDGDIYLPKMIVDKERGSFLTISEYIEAGLHVWQKDLPYPYEVVPNSEEDLRDAALEMENLLHCPVPPQENHLQRKWKNAFPPGSQCQFQKSMVSSSFIASHQDLYN